MKPTTEGRITAILPKGGSDGDGPPSDMLLGNFELHTTCTSSECDDIAVRILILVEPDAEKAEDRMTVCCLCLPHTIHHESLFEERSNN